MAVYQSWSLGLLQNPEREDCNQQNLQACSWWKDHTCSMEFLWSNCYHDPFLCEGLINSNAGKSEHILFRHDREFSFENETATFVASLKICAKNRDLHKGTKIHEDIIKQGLQKKCADALVFMYARCGALAIAKDLLEMHKCRNVSSWTALVAGYTRQGLNQDAMNCYECMQREGLSPSPATFACILKACGSLLALDTGKQVHEMIKSRCLLVDDIVLGTSLVDMYAKCGALAKAHKVLEELPSRDVFCWSALIASYAQQGQGEQAIESFEHMQHEGHSPDAITYACILRACGTVGAIDKGVQIHKEIARQGLLQGDVVLGTSLVDMYARCGALQKAQSVLEELPSRDVVSWGALIAGYVEHGHGEKALTCYERMQQEGFSPDAAIYACILKACGIIGAIDKGELFYDEIARKALLESNEVLSTALVCMYAKCGALAKAQLLLEELPFSNVVAWSALVAGYSQLGQMEQALCCFRQMQSKGFSPNAVTFSCVLNACTHLGLVEEGHKCFVSMTTKHGVKPKLEHYVCMVDLYGRAGNLERAVNLIQEMPSSNHSSVWHTLLSGCQKWGDVDLASWAFQQAVQVNKGDEPAYLLMANIYAAAGRHKDAVMIESMRLENRSWKSEVND